MRIVVRGLMAAALLGLGYLAGSGHWLVANPLAAQSALPAQPPRPPSSGLTPAQARKLELFHDSLNRAAVELARAGRYRPVTRGVNTFAVSVGGLDVRDDLENQRGVDPETFAGLYADEAIDEIDPFLERDKDGRLTYKGSIVRLYSLKRLKALFAERAKYLGNRPK